MKKSVRPLSSMMPIMRKMRAMSFQGLGLNAIARRRLDGSRAVILNYHRVIEQEQADRDSVEEAMYVTPETFSLQVEVLKEHFNVLPLSELAERIVAGSSLPSRACAITFDDGWRDNYDHAYPALARAGLPATVFVVTDRVGTSGAFWPDDVRRRMGALDRAGRSALSERLCVPEAGPDVDAAIVELKRLDEETRKQVLAALPVSKGLEDKRELMTWDELRILDQGTIDIESHGVTHAILTGLDPSAIRRELIVSRDTLLERGFGRNRLFAYPSGCFDVRVAGVAAEVGYRAAFTLVGRVATATSLAMEIPRIGIHDGMGRGRLDFLCKIPGWRA